jgi:hypothetical protein
MCVINEIQNIKLELSVAFDGFRFKDPCYIFDIIIETVLDKAMFPSYFIFKIELLLLIVLMLSNILHCDKF